MCVCACSPKSWLFHWFSFCWQEWTCCWAGNAASWDWSGGEWQKKERTNDKRGQAHRTPPIYHPDSFRPLPRRERDEADEGSKTRAIEIKEKKIEIKTGNWICISNLRPVLKIVLFTMAHASSETTNPPPVLPKALTPSWFGTTAADEKNRRGVGGGGKGLPTVKTTVTKERVKECAFQQKKIFQWNKLSRDRFIPPIKLDDKLVDILKNAVSSSYKIIRLTPVSKLTLHTIFYTYACKCVYVCMCVCHRAHTIKVFMLTNQFRPEMRSKVPSHHAFIINWKEVK